MSSRSKKEKRSIDNRHVSVDALNWAIRHVIRHGDTDIFPVPFEYEALADEWPDLLKPLTQRNFRGLPLRSHLAWAVPKGHTGFRIAHQLDPLDTLVYTALVYEMGKVIERSRQPKTVACAYRFRPKDRGDFYPGDNGWATFTRRSRDLANKHTFVLHMDIADFYNQIYHHRLAGALETAGISKERAENFEAYIGGFTAWQSQGIPVGPSASSLLAECCLSDIDSSLRAMRIPFVRYIDDFRIFASTKANLVRVLHEVTKLLYTNHRLAIQSGKTYIQRAEEFIQRNLDDPQRVFEGEMEDRLSELVDQLNSETGYEKTIDDVSEEQVGDEVQNCLDSLFHESLQAVPIRFGTIRFVLREAARWGTDEMTALVVKHLESLTPIIGDVSRFLRRMVPNLTPHEARETGNSLLRVGKKSSHSGSDFLAICILDLLASFPQLVSFRRAMAFAQSRALALGIRPQALLARAHGETFWVRQHKEDLMEHGPWDRRAVIWAASVLPASERRAWLTRVRGRLDDRLEIALADHVAES